MLNRLIYNMNDIFNIDKEVLEMKIDIIRRKFKPFVFPWSISVYNKPDYKKIFY